MMPWESISETMSELFSIKAWNRLSFQRDAASSGSILSGLASGGLRHEACSRALAGERCPRIQPPLAPSMQPDAKQAHARHSFQSRAPVTSGFLFHGLSFIRQGRRAHLL